MNIRKEIEYKIKMIADIIINKSEIYLKHTGYSAISVEGKNELYKLSESLQEYIQQYSKAFELFGINVKDYHIYYNNRKLIYPDIGGWTNL